MCLLSVGLRRFFFFLRVHFVKVLGVRGTNVFLKDSHYYPVMFQQNLAIVWKPRSFYRESLGL